MSDEILRIMCPKLTCRRILAVPAEARGRTVRCKGCATVIRVPAKAAPLPIDADGSGKPTEQGTPAAPEKGGDKTKAA